MPPRRSQAGQAFYIEYVMAVLGVVAIATITSVTARWMGQQMVNRNADFQGSRVSASTSHGGTGIGGPGELHLLEEGPHTTDSRNGIGAQSLGLACTAELAIMAQSQVLRAQAKTDYDAALAYIVEAARLANLADGLSTGFIWYANAVWDSNQAAEAIELTQPTCQKNPCWWEPCPQPPDPPNPHCGEYNCDTTRSVLDCECWNNKADAIDGICRGWDGWYDPESIRHWLGGRPGNVGGQNVTIYGPRCQNQSVGPEATCSSRLRDLASVLDARGQALEGLAFPSIQSAIPLAQSSETDISEADLTEAGAINACASTQ